MSERECGDCTACCEGWLNANIDGQILSPGVACRHLCSTGCGIYPNHPQDPCQGFECAWLTSDSALPDWMQPNQCGAIVVLNFPWKGWQTIRAVAVGETIPDKTLEWLKGHARSTGKPLIIKHNKQSNGRYEKQPAIGYGPPAFVFQVKTMLSEEDVYLGPAASTND